MNDFGNSWCKREHVEFDVLKEWKLNTFDVIDKCIEFCFQDNDLLPPKSKSTFRHLNQGIQEIHWNDVLVPADKAADNVIVV